MEFAKEEDIRVRAYHLWEASGRPDGRDLEFWETAQQSLANGNHRAAPTAAGPTRAKARSRPAKAAGSKSGDAASRRKRQNT